MNPAPHAHTAEEIKPPRYIVATDGQEATVFDLTRGKDLFPATTDNRRYALTAGGCTHETATLIADALNYDQRKAFDLLRRSLSEIDNLQRKIAAKEQEGWEGSRRRSILKHELAAALTQATAKP